MANIQRHKAFVKLKIVNNFHAHFSIIMTNQRN